MIFWPMFRFRLLDILMTCIVIVLPPLVICLALMLLAAARAIATGFTPGWYANHLSSNSMRAVLNFSGTVSGGGNLHCPSLAIRAPRSSPFLSVTTVE